MNAEPEEPREHAMHIKRMLSEVLDHCREDQDKVAEPKAQALFETTAEVLLGLQTAYESYLRGPGEVVTPKPTTVTDGEGG